MAMSVVVSFAACGRKPEDLRLGERFVAAAKLAPPAADDGALMTEALSLYEPHDDVVPAAIRALGDSGRVSLDLLDRDIARALALVLTAHEAGAALPPGDCTTSAIGLYGIATALVATAPVGDSAQLEAALWLGQSVGEQRPSAIGAMIAVSIAEKAVARLRQSGVAPSASMAGYTPPVDLIRRVFAREALCIEQRIVSEPGSKGTRSAELALIGSELGAFVDYQRGTLAALDAAGDSPRAQIAALVKAASEAKASGSRLVSVLVLSDGLWTELDEKRTAVADYLAGRPAPATPAAAEVQVEASDKMAESGRTLVFVGDSRGVRVLALDRAHPWYALGFRNGDLVSRFDETATNEAGLAAMFEGLPNGRHRAELSRHGKPVTLTFVVVNGSDAPRPRPPHAPAHPPRPRPRPPPRPRPRPRPRPPTPSPVPASPSSAICAVSSRPPALRSSGTNPPPPLC